MSVTFDVIGVPTGQGSMKAFSAGGHARLKPSGGNKFAAWRNAVSEAARTAMGGAPALDGMLHLTAVFRFPLPASRSKKLRALGGTYKTTAPDVDKLLRLVCDSLTAAAVIVDDARICSVTASKVETVDWCGATITIRRMDIA